MLRRLDSTQLLLTLFKPLIRSRQPADVARRAFKKILVIRQHDQLGDMLCAVPLLRSLRHRYPGARIALMTSPVNHEAMLHNPYVDRVINYDKTELVSRFFLRPARVLKLIRELRKEKFELTIVPSTVSTSATSDLLAYLSGAPYRMGAEQIDGIENPSAAFFNCPVSLSWKEDPHRHQALRNLDIARSLDLSLGDLSSEIGLTGQEVGEAKWFLSRVGMTGSFIAYHPGAGKPPNRWPAERFAGVANALTNEFKLGVLITYGPMDSEPVRIMESRLAGSYVVVERKSIREVAAILSLACLAISNDTGIMHVAAAARTPVLSLFGSTDPEQWAPIGRGNRYIQGRGGDIGNITVDDVLVVARTMLDKL